MSGRDVGEDCPTEGVVSPGPDETSHMAPALRPVSAVPSITPLLPAAQGK